MNLLSNLQFTIHRIFELYKTQGKRWYGFSMLFTIFSLLFCTLVTGALLFVYYAVERMTDGTGVSVSRIFEGMFLSNDLTIYSQFAITLTFGLYALFIYLQEQSPATDKITFGRFFESIGGNTLWLYLLFTVGGIVVSKLTGGLLNPSLHFDRDSLRQFTGLVEGGFSPFMEWLFSLLQFLLNQLPIVLTFFLIRMHLSKRGLVLVNKEVRTAFFALLIVYFAINNFSIDVVYFVNSYIMKLIMIPFTEALIPTVLLIAIYVFLIALFAAGIAGSLIYPFLYHNETIPSGNEDLIDE